MNATAPVPGQSRCPHCGAEVYWSEATQCWGCGRPLGWFERANREARARPARRGNRLGSVMLGVALIAVGLGAIRVAPGLGIVLAILATPALVRTALVAADQEARGRPLTLLEKVGVFAGTLAAVVVVGVTAIVAFVATCFPIGLAGFSAGSAGGVLVFIGFLVGFCAALAAGYGAYRLIRRIGQ